MKNLKKNNLIEIKSDDDFIIDLMYAKNENIMGENVYEKVGLGNRCIVHIDLWNNLQQLRPVLKNHKLKLKICDAYRPPQAHLICTEIISLDGFFAKKPERSQHCRACAIDVVLIDESNNELEFPCQVDAYEEKFVAQLKNGQTDEFFEHLKKANYDYVGKGIENRDFLRKIMEAAGFIALHSEWWHFNMEPRDANPPKYKMIDIL